MPNWCENYLRVTGNDKDLISFKNRAKQIGKDNKTDLSLNNFIPMPKELKDTISPCNPNRALRRKFGFDNWYDWRIANWGVKCEIDAAHLTDGKGELTYCFDSAWSPPLKAIEKMSKQYPELNFYLEYIEPSMAFCGQFEVISSKIKQDICNRVEYGICPVCKEDSYKTLAGECGMCGEEIKKFAKSMNKKITGKGGGVADV